MFFEGKDPYPGNLVFSSGRIITLKTCCYFMDRIREWYFYDNFFDGTYTKILNKTFVPGPCPHVIIRSPLLICHLNCLNRPLLWTKLLEALLQIRLPKMWKEEEAEVDIHWSYTICKQPYWFTCINSGNHWGVNVLKHIILDRKKLRPRKVKQFAHWW